MIKTVFFDLDGTLLPMDQDTFARAYFSGLAKKVAPLGYEPEKLVAAIWRGTGAMVANDGSVTNEEAFWKTFCGIFGEDARADEPSFAEYYATGFQSVKEVCGFQPLAAPLIRRLREAGFRVILATNPLFPAIATESRIRWAGLEPEEFEFYTTYENSRFSKPNPDYYRDLIRRFDLDPTECMMVGNDYGEDMVAAALGMEVFLVTDCLIAKEGADLEKYPHGDFVALVSRVDRLLQEKK